MPLAPAANGIWVAVGHNGLRMASRDGTTWENVQTGREGEVYHSVCFGAGKCVALGRFGGANLIAVTVDGVNWKSFTKDARYSRYVSGLLFAQNRFLSFGGEPVTVGASRPFLIQSPDGENWSDYQEIGGKEIIRRVAWGNGRYVGVGDRGRRSTSPDGVQWQDVPGVKAIDTLVDVGFGNGVFVGVGLHGLRMVSRDGVTWDQRFTGEEGEHLNSVIWTGAQFVAVGQGATYFSKDGFTWDRRPNQNAPLTAAFGPGFYLGAAWKGRVLRSADAVRWEPVFKAEQHVEAIAHGPAFR